MNEDKNLPIERCESLCRQISSYNKKADLNLIRRAFDFAVERHSNQTRASGEPYYYHPYEVAKISADLHLDDASIAAALLHDTVEDTSATIEEIREFFGEEVAGIVDGLTKLARIKYQPDHIRQAENFRKLFVAISEDIRVLLIKLADRLHNMLTLHHISSAEKRSRIAHETMDIYAALAERIGVHKIKNQLQDLAFAELYPEVRKSIISRLNFIRGKDIHLVDRISMELENLLKQNGISAQVSGREKTPCSIWFKMERKNLSFDQLSDIIAFRVLVKDMLDCYRALGVIHSEFHNIPGSFKDFISTPKENGYQSIHTVIIGPERHKIEVQIRTLEMHEVAEMGVATHWLYKQGGKFSKEGKQYNWLRRLLMMLEENYEPETLLENAKVEIHYDQVFVFTPKGMLVALPPKATPVDFAYAIHSDLGNSCVGAKVNGSIVPLRTQLNNGDQVEIMTSLNHKPSPSWESFVVTAKAKTEIRKFARQHEHEEYTELGKVILSKLLKKENIKLDANLTQRIIAIFKCNTIDGFYLAVGKGEVTPEDVKEKLLGGDGTIARFKKHLRLFAKLTSGSKRKEDKSRAQLITGITPGTAMQFAKCCHPLPGEAIVGIVNTGRGITIHNRECDNLKNYEDKPECWIDIGWQDNDGESKFTGRLKLVLVNQPGSLAEITQAIANEHGNISNFKIIGRSVDFFDVLVDIEVKDVEHLNALITSLRCLAHVNGVERYKV